MPVLRLILGKAMDQENIIIFYCPFCTQSTRYYERQSPLGRTKKCKKCQGTFVLDENSMSSPDLRGSDLSSVTNFVLNSPPQNLQPKIEKESLTSFSHPFSHSLVSSSISSSISKEPMDEDASVFLDPTEIHNLMDEDKKNDEESFAVSQDSLAIERKIEAQTRVVLLKSRLKNFFTKAFFLLLVSLIGLAIYQGTGELREFRELSQEYKFFNTSKTSFSPIQGKVFISVYGKGYNSTWMKQLPHYLRPKTSNEVEIIAVVYTKKKLLTSKYKIKGFSQPGTVYGYHLTVKIIDRKTDGIVVEKSFPAEKILPLNLKFDTVTNNGATSYEYIIEIDQKKREEVVYFIQSTIEEFKSKKKK